MLDVLAWIMVILLPLVVLYILGCIVDANDGSMFTTRAVTLKVIAERILMGLLGVIFTIILLSITIGFVLLVEWAYSKVGLL